MKNEKEISPAKAVEISGEGTAIEKANAYERKIQLEGRQDPDNFKLAEGKTLSEIRASLRDAHVEEASKASEVQEARMRELSTEGDPIYSKDAKVMTGQPGSAVIVSSTEKPAEVSASTLKKLPNDFPGRIYLAARGYRTVDSVRNAADADLLQIEGVDETRLAEIRTAISGID